MEEIRLHLLADQAMISENKASDGFSQLSPREREVLQLIAEGHTSKDIASKQNISFKTVDTHRSNLEKKLGIHSIAGLTSVNPFEELNFRIAKATTHRLMVAFIARGLSIYLKGIQ